MSNIKEFLKRQVAVSKTELDVFEENEFNVVNRFYYETSPSLRELFNEEYVEKRDKNETLHELLTFNLHIPDILDAVLRSVDFVEKIFKHKKVNNQAKKVVGESLWLLTFTLHPDDTEAALKRYATNNLKRFKHIMVEEHGTEGGRYHIHAIVEAPYLDPNRKKFFKPAAYSKGHIDIKRYSFNNDFEAKYLSKENKPTGDIEYIKGKVSNLPKSSDYYK